jgi:hypothetical protein
MLATIITPIAVYLAFYSIQNILAIFENRNRALRSQFPVYISWYTPRSYNQVQS